MTDGGGPHTHVGRGCDFVGEGGQGAFLTLWLLKAHPDRYLQTPPLLIAQAFPYGILSLLFFSNQWHCSLASGPQFKMGEGRT